MGCSLCLLVLLIKLLIICLFVEREVNTHFKMTDILTIDIIDNGKGGHKDLLFSIPNLMGDTEFDTYYFCLAVEPVENIDDIKNAVSQLLQFWIDKVSESKEGETIFLPIDFSDQYTGCLKIQNQDAQLVLTYGCSRREGWAVDPLNPGNYYREITDFEADSEKQMTVDPSVFISTLSRQMSKLKGRTT
jgi:hypothetical protein